MWEMTKAKRGERNIHKNLASASATVDVGSDKKTKKCEPNVHKNFRHTCQKVARYSRCGNCKHRLTSHEPNEPTAANTRWSKNGQKLNTAENIF